MEEKLRGEQREIRQIEINLLFVQLNEEWHSLL